MLPPDEIPTTTEESADARPADPPTTEEAAPPEAKPSTNGHAVDDETRPLAEGIDTPTPPLPTATEAHERFEAIFGGIQAPFAFLDLDAVWANADMLRRSRGSRSGSRASRSDRGRCSSACWTWTLGSRERSTPCRRRTGSGSTVSETWSSPIRPPIGRPSPARADHLGGPRGGAGGDGRLGRAPRPDRGGGDLVRRADPGGNRHRPFLVALGVC